MHTQPIGIFDSGIGGMTVTKAIVNLLPNEDIIYFGDTAHLPYGDKSTAAIQAYSIKICDFLLSKGCKCIVIACNSASAAAYDLVKEYVGSKALVVNVIDPAVQYVCQYLQSKTVGIIGTVKTISSGVYEKNISDCNNNIVLKPLATKLLAPMIEEGFFNHTISRSIIDNYLSSPVLSGIDALVLACTHYPLIKQPIEDFYQKKVEIIDSSEMVAESLKGLLIEKNLLNGKKERGEMQVFVSDFTPSYEASTRIFFGKQIQLRLHTLWE